MNKACGCKGIRTCLLCESNEVIPVHQKVELIYTFCQNCGLCWPEADHSLYVHGNPLYLGKIKVYEDFISKEEETLAILEMDKIPWMPSQSGRRKQDFGPKVNFKKKKVKIGGFKGFPSFTKSMLEKFKEVPELYNFQAVELCHLEYSPERGSSIDPHVDDFWLWGERLVTVNLSSTTVLTLVPFSNSKCQCLKKSISYHSSKAIDCKFANNCESGNNFILDAPSDSLTHPSDTAGLCTHVITPQKERTDFCSIFRSASVKPSVAVRVELPPRSLLVLSDCARYNWYHEIKRRDVSTRRLAMTFRELSPEFLFDGKESQVGKDLLSIASNFCDFG